MTKFTFRATEHSLCAQATLSVKADAVALVATMPKSIKAHGGAITNMDSPPFTENGYIQVFVKIAANGVNKGTNEGGLRRWAAFKKWAAANGHELVYEAPYSNSLPEAEARAF